MLEHGHSPGTTRRTSRSFTFLALLAASSAVGLILICCSVAVARTSPSQNASCLKAPIAVASYFYPSGWMGDGASGTRYVRINKIGNYYEITYLRGPTGWAGIYWQYPSGNWGDKAGRCIKYAKHLTFTARSRNGRDIVTFESGGIVQKGTRHKNQPAKKIYVTLSERWATYTIGLEGEDLSNVIGAFAWVATSRDNPHGVVFDVKAIRFAH